ncbi:tyrosine-type recombinase/integrase [Gracilibacillus marinus]|uniref:Tyrosine-type recombinase/integrase n=1 Tax=Gracilibacillus marinus TaxID=630535 RepID=A0ABV8VUZ8_9BACI
MLRKGKKIVQRRTSINPIASNEVTMTLSQAFDFVYSQKQSEGLREKTLHGYKVLYPYFTKWIGETYPEVTCINQVTSELVRNYINYLRFDKVNQKTGELGLSPYSINVKIRMLKSFFNVLHREEIIERNPITGIKLLKVDEDVFQPLTNEEIKRLLSTPNVEYYAQFRDLVAMYLMLDTGIRSSELFAMKISYVDFKSRCIILSGTVTKNRKPRVLPLSNQVLRLVMELIQEVKTNFDTEYLFVSNFGERYMPNSFRKRLHNYKTLAGIDKRLSPHSLRHQFCRDYIMNGGDVFSLQRIAGHSDIQTTRKYIQFTTEDIQRKHTEFSPIARLRGKYRK